MLPTNIRNDRSLASCAVILSLVLCAAAAGCGEGDPGDDGGDPDGGRPDLVEVVDGNPYAGTCIDEVFQCFDWELPCVDTNDGLKLIETFDSGAVWVSDVAKQQITATSSGGEVCFTTRTDPADPTVTIVETASSGTFRLRGNEDTQTQTIECPDGSMATAQGFRPPVLDALDTCETP